MTVLVVIVVVGLAIGLVLGLVIAADTLREHLAGRQAASLWRARWQAEDELRRVGEAGRRAMYETVRRHQRGGS